jgi:sulfite dehydrogenase
MHHEQYDSLTRRDWLAASSLAGLAALTGCQKQQAATPVPTKPRVDAPYDQLLKFKDKVPMRAINDRPPCLETPWEYFKHDLTPNEAFYVRWHLQTLPTIDVNTWKLKLGGHINKPLELSLADLRKMPSSSIVAVNQCSGNSRGLFQPQIPGAQWGNGAMSNAKWTGVKLADVLKLAGVKEGAVEVTLKGLDKGGPETVPDYVKSIPLAEAMRADVLLAYDMNGAEMPPLNGYPLRLVVPGWFATYWVKAIGEINVVNKPFDGYWMQKAYRIPKGDLVDKPGNLAKETIPIHKMLVRSFFVLPSNASSVPSGKPTSLEGIAFDGGSGIKAVEVSDDGGKTWKAATLGDDLGGYSFRRWRLNWTPAKAGEHKLLVKATANSGETQPMQVGWNRAGYLRNHAESWTLTAS